MEDPSDLDRLESDFIGSQGNIAFSLSVFQP